MQITRLTISKGKATTPETRLTHTGINPCYRKKDRYKTRNHADQSRIEETKATKQPPPPSNKISATTNNRSKTGKILKEAGTATSTKKTAFKHQIAIKQIKKQLLKV